MSAETKQAGTTTVMEAKSGDFVWFELRTTDGKVAEAFYTHVIGWKVKDSGNPGGVPYRLFEAGGVDTAGLMEMPQAMRAGGVRAAWVGFVGVEDVDQAARRVEEAGGRLCFGPQDIPGVGRFASVADPQGAEFLLFRGSSEAPERPTQSMTVPGTIGWVELSADDEGAAWTFYSELLGWKEDRVMDMGPMGPYRMFGNGGAATGGMMNRDRSQSAVPFWRYYINVEDVDAAAGRIREKGGRIDSGPHPVPGNIWVLMGTDPQGVIFSIAGPRNAGHDGQAGVMA